MESQEPTTKPDSAASALSAGLGGPTSGQDFVWVSERRYHIDCPILSRATMCCENCKTYWIGQAPQHCQDCGIAAKYYRPFTTPNVKVTGAPLHDGQQENER